MDRHKMRLPKAAGRNAAVLKYDLLTSLGAHGCAGDKHLQRLVLRLITLIVARYNWQNDEISVGQREMAALWSVDERTVKRDTARLRELGWLVVKRPAARGRVTVFGLGMAAILTGTKATWDKVGPDFVARMAEPAPEVPKGNVISFPGAAPVAQPGLWGRVLAALHAENPAVCATWFTPLLARHEDGVLVLTAPSRFHASFVITHHLTRLTSLARQIDPSVERMEVGV